MKDFRDNDIGVGDEIAYTVKTYGGRCQLRHGKVKSLHDDAAVIEVLMPRQVVQYRNQLVLLKKANG